MKLNKRRTLVTIIGIIISVAMITAVSTLGYSIMDFYARNAMESTGYFHFKYSNYMYEDIDVILDEFDVENYALIKNVGDYSYTVDDEGNVVTASFVYDEENTTETQDVMRVEAVSDNYFEMMKIKLSEGRFPENSGEVLLSSAMCERYRNSKTGDEIVIGQQKYTICGKIAYTDFESRDLSLPGAWTYPVYTKLDTSSLKKTDLVSGYFYAGGALDNIEERAEDVLSKLKRSDIPSGQMAGDNLAWYCDGTNLSYNYRVLSFLGLSRYDNVNTMMDILKLILVVIIMVGSVSLIANGFIISISERSRYLGMLASIGATKKQKRGSVYFEGFLEGIIAIPLGILAGIGGIGVTFKFIEPLVRDLSGSETGLRVIVNGRVILWAVVFSVLTIFLSAYIPAKRASMIAPIDAIRQNKDVKITSRTVKTMGITKKIFGFEGDLALKNLKRNKKRYRVTVFSMFISLTLFISVFSFVYFMKKGITAEIETEGYDMEFSYSNSNNGDEHTAENKTFLGVTDNVLNSWSEYIEKSQRYTYVVVYGDVEDITGDSVYNEDYIEFLEKCNLIRDNRVSLLTMSETDLREYLKKAGIDYEKFVEKDNNVILFDGLGMTCYTDDGERRTFYGNVYNDNIIDVKYQYTMGDEYDENGEIIEATSEKVNMDYHIYSSQEKLFGMDKSRVYLLVTPQMTKQLCEKMNAKLYNYIRLDTTNDKKLEEAFKGEMEKVGASESDYYIVNNLEEKNMIDKSMLLISVFVYGFIILMSLICIANIVNTISTSIALRRREFAMLKSVGMTDKAFHKMIAYESAFYGIKALIFGLPVGTGVMLLIKNTIEDEISFDMGIPWMGYIIAIVGVFVVIGTTMLYSARRIKKENVIDALKNENT